MSTSPPCQTKSGGRSHSSVRRSRLPRSLYAVSVTDGKGKPLAELKKYDTSGKGTVRFSPYEPLPAALVTKLVKANIARIRPRAESETRVGSSNG